MESSALSAPLIATHNLTKRYGEHPALTEANITVPAGTIYGFLGPNGAGKTTFIRLLMGFIQPTSGSAAMFGYDTWRHGVEARQEVGYLVPASGLYPDLSGSDQLDYAAKLSRQSPVLRRQVLDALELSDTALNLKLGTYSKGMRQKLALTAAMQGDPALLILDEPTDGLDPLIQRNFEELLRSMRDRGRTIFMSSHDLAEVEHVCEQVAVVRAGRIVAEERIADLQQRHASRVSIRFHGAVPAGIDTVPGVKVDDIRDSQVDLLATGDPNPLLKFVANHPVDEILITRASLEDIFMTYYEGGA
ncbi:MAG: ABC transporter ATP-binding protein [Thermomicrobiales bacterium]|nr:ABC transporter ATP-binding protein [Thermomicrobiales bacterium]